MKKVILLSFIFAVAMMFNSSDVNAQSFEKGDINVGGGIGIGSTLGGGLPIGVHVEFGVTDNISVGAYAAFASYNAGFSGFDWKYTYTIIGARGAYHFGELLNAPDNLDVYGGVGLYNYSVKVKSDLGGAFTGTSGSGLHFGVHAGARYYFTDNIGAYAELGSGIAYLQLGVTLKL